MEYAVLKSGGKQYKVSTGETLEIDKVEGVKDASIELEEVLLYVSGDTVKVGKPSLLGFKVKAKVLEQKKGEKVLVEKYKSKVRYRRRMGFRPHLTKILIEKIETGLNRKEKKAEKPAKVVKKK